MLPVKDNVLKPRVAWVTVGLILINAVAYVMTVWHGGSLISGPSAHNVVKYGAIPSAITHGRARWETLFSSMFVHASIVHLAGTMLFLWIFGTTVETTLGSIRFLLLYVIAGLVTLGLELLIVPNSTAPTLGASGAVAGVLGAYLLLYPRAKVLAVVFVVLFFTVIELPLILMLGLWFVEQVVFAAAHLTDPLGGAGAMAYLASLGGFAFGLLAVKLLVRSTNSGGPAVAGA